MADGHGARPVCSVLRVQSHTRHEHEHTHTQFNCNVLRCNAEVGIFLPQVHLYQRSMHQTKPPSAQVPHWSQATDMRPNMEVDVAHCLASWVQVIS